jgi:alanine racemase
MVADLRWAWVEVDLGAYARNVSRIVRAASPSATWAVVKADAYGHGAVPCARAALDAGASGLCVATVAEGLELRSAGIGAPVLVLGEQPPEQFPAAVAARLALTASRTDVLVALSAAAQSAGVPAAVHVEVDTGMHRVGAEPEEAAALAARIAADDWLDGEGCFTHFAVADEPGRDGTTAAQLAAFRGAVEACGRAGWRPRLLHAANSAALLRGLVGGADGWIVRAGIAAYGIDPDPLGDEPEGFEPVLSLRARVSHVQRRRAGEAVSYGLRRPLDRDATVATLPLGYADGLRRDAWRECEVLVGGRRRRFAGTVTMDQSMVDCGDDPVSVGDEAVLIGAQAGARIPANEWARRLGTIGYEITCAISRRVPRRWVA